jgi:DNA-binding NarL/FixJ family response regulator
MKDACKVILVDDYAVVKAGCRMLLAGMTDMNVLGEADTGEEACTKFQTHAPDVKVIDLNLPGIGRLEAIRRIIHRDRQAKILVFSIHDEGVYVSRALEAGALGYLCKSSHPEVLVEAVLTCSRGMAFIDPSLNIQAPATRRKTPPSRNPIAGLTPREFDIFCLMAQGHSVRDTATALSISVKTVGNYVTIIKEKLGVSTNTELVKLAYEHRLLTPGQLTEDQTHPEQSDSCL